MNPVLEFLQEHPDYSFDEGVAVLLRYSANRGVNTFITMRRDRQHLRNELNRLAHIPNLRPLPGMEEPKPKVQEPEPVQQLTQETDSPKNPDPKPDGSDEDDFVSFTNLKRHETYKPEDLPTPMLKELWEKNRDEYKELQHCHTQMKQANSDAGRADWRNKVIAHRESISKRWKLFDEEMERVNTEKAAQADTQQKAYNPLNDRAYISKSLKKEEWDDARKLEVQHRVDALLQHNQTITEETKKALRERGITIE